MIQRGRSRTETAFRWQSWLAFVAQFGIALASAAGVMYPGPTVHMVLLFFTALQKHATDKAAEWRPPRDELWTDERRDQNRINELEMRGYPPEAMAMCRTHLAKVIAGGARAEHEDAAG